MQTENMSFMKDQIPQIPDHARAAYEKIAQIADQILNKTCLDILGEQKGVYIKQKFDLLEILTGLDTANSYKVYPTDEQGKRLRGHKAMFKCKEYSSSCWRNCCPARKRPFEMKCVNYKCGDFDPNFSRKVNRDESRTVFKMNRQYTCTCLCFNRPHLQVYHTEKEQNIKLGTIVNPWFWYNFGCDILDSNDNLKYKIEANCFQTYFWFRCPCNSCNYVEFKILNASGDVVSHLAKRGVDCQKNALGDVDHFTIVFPDQATKEDKGLLMIAILMLDYMYFEEQKRDRGPKIKPNG